jgi:glyoxylase-like metal-dependent hydrolase (beta-lactamase superfamily II)
MRSTPSDRSETYTITAVRYGGLETHRSDVFLNHGDYPDADGPATMDYYFWIVRNSARTVVLDTGFDPAVGARRGRTALIDPREAFDALEVVDDPATTVVLSHAHYDHVGNARHFRAATFLMARAEYDFWIGHPRRLWVTDRLAEAAELDVLERAFDDRRLTLLDGGGPIAPGIDVVAGAGHTPGQLMLAVNTEDGPVLLTSDAVHVVEELERRMPFRHMCDLSAAADTYDVIDELLRSGRVARAFAGHQPGLLGHYAADPRLPQHTAILTSPIQPPTEGPNDAS